jgi:hypothetical protein
MILGCSSLTFSSTSSMATTPSVPWKAMHKSHEQMTYSSSIRHAR